MDHLWTNGIYWLVVDLVSDTTSSNLKLFSFIMDIWAWAGVKGRRLTQNFAVFIFQSVYFVRKGLFPPTTTSIPSPPVSIKLFARNHGRLGYCLVVLRVVEQGMNRRNRKLKNNKKYIQSIWHYTRFILMHGVSVNVQKRHQTVEAIALGFEFSMHSRTLQNKR